MASMNSQWWPQATSTAGAEMLGRKEGKRRMMKDSEVQVVESSSSPSPAAAQAPSNTKSPPNQKPKRKSQPTVLPLSPSGGSSIAGSRASSLAGTPQVQGKDGLPSLHMSLFPSLPSGTDKDAQRRDASSRHLQDDEGPSGEGHHLREGDAKRSLQFGDDADALEQSLRHDAHTLYRCRDLLIQLRKEADPLDRHMVLMPGKMLGRDSLESKRSNNSSIGQEDVMPATTHRGNCHHMHPHNHHHRSADLAAHYPCKSIDNNSNSNSSESCRFCGGPSAPSTSTATATTPSTAARSLSPPPGHHGQNWETPPTVRSSPRMVLSEFESETRILAKRIALEHAGREIDSIAGEDDEDSTRFADGRGKFNSKVLLQLRNTLAEAGNKRDHGGLSPADALSCAEVAIDALFDQRSKSRALQEQIEELRESNASLRKQLERERLSRVELEEENSGLRLRPGRERLALIDARAEGEDLKMHLVALQQQLGLEVRERMGVEAATAELRKMADAGKVLASEVVVLRQELEACEGQLSEERGRAEAADCRAADAEDSLERWKVMNEELEVERDELSVGLAGALSRLRDAEERSQYTTCASCGSMARELERERRRTEELLSKERQRASEIERETRALLERKMHEVEESASRAMGEVKAAAADVEKKLSQEAKIAKQEMQALGAAARSGGAVGGGLVRIAELQAEVAALKEALAAVRGGGTAPRKSPRCSV